MGLRENLWREPISRLSLHKAVAVAPSLPIREAVRLMRINQVGAVLTTGADGRAGGMFHEKLLIRLLADRPTALDEPVGLHATSRITCLHTDDPVARLIDVMQKHGLRWVCVVDDAGKTVALAGLRSVMEFVVDHFPRSVKVQPIEPKLSMQRREGE